MTDKEIEKYYSFVEFDHQRSYVFDRRIYPMTRKLPIMKVEDIAYVCQNVLARTHLLGLPTEKWKIRVTKYSSFGGGSCMQVLSISPRPEDFSAIISRRFRDVWIDPDKGLPESGTVVGILAKDYFKENEMFVDTSEFTWNIPYPTHPIEAKTLREINGAFSKMTRAYIEDPRSLWFFARGNANITFNIAHTRTPDYDEPIEYSGVSQVYYRSKSDSYSYSLELKGFHDVANEGKTSQTVRFSVGRGYVKKEIVIYVVFDALISARKLDEDGRPEPIVNRQKYYIMKYVPSFVEEDEESHELLFELGLDKIKDGIDKGRELCGFDELEGYESFSSNIYVVKAFAICDIIGDVTIPYNQVES